MRLEHIKHGATGAIARTYRHPRRGVVETLTQGNVVTLRCPRNAYGWRDRVDQVLGYKPAVSAASSKRRLGKQMRALR